MSEPYCAHLKTNIYEKITSFASPMYAVTSVSHAQAVYITFPINTQQIFRPKVDRAEGGGGVTSGRCHGCQVMT